MEGYIAEIRLFGGNFNPRGWMLCQGQSLPIAQYQALFALIGTTYGGNGQTTFSLPDFRGRIGVGAGQGSLSTVVVQGEAAGTESVTLTLANLPIHNHPMFIPSPLTQGANAEKVSNDINPTGKYPGIVGDSTAYSTTSDSNMAAYNNFVLSTAGSNQPISILQPSLGLNFIICLEGIFPSRN